MCITTFCGTSSLEVVSRNRIKIFIRRHICIYFYVSLMNMRMGWSFGRLTKRTKRRGSWVIGECQWTLMSHLFLSGLPLYAPLTKQCLILRPTVSRAVLLRIKHPSAAYDQICITLRQLRVCWYGALPLTRVRVCRLQLLLVLASAVIFYCLRSKTSLSVASYDSQGYGGGIRPRRHTGSELSVGNAAEFYSEVDQFESPPGHLRFWLRCFLCYPPILLTLAYST
jgi:hypothetical protein